MDDLAKHKKLNFLLYKLFWEIHSGTINPISPGEVGLITKILINRIFWQSNDQTFELGSPINEEDLEWLERELHKVISRSNRQVDDFFDWMDENGEAMGVT